MFKKSQKFKITLEQSIKDNILETASILKYLKGGWLGGRMNAFKGQLRAIKRNNFKFCSNPHFLFFSYSSYSPPSDSYEAR